MFFAALSNAHVLNDRGQDVLGVGAQFCVSIQQFRRVSPRPRRAYDCRTLIGAELFTYSNGRRVQ